MILIECLMKPLKNLKKIKKIMKKMLDKRLKVWYNNYSERNEVIEMASFDKAKETKKERKQWWIIHTHNYSVYIWALPILPIVLLSDYIKEYNSKKRVWSEETATKILDKVLPQVLEWVEEENAFYYCMSWGTSSLYRKAPRKYRKWADKFEYKLQQFIKEGYENADYVKTIEKDYYDTWVKFVEKKLDK